MYTTTTQQVGLGQNIYGVGKGEAPKEVTRANINAAHTHASHLNSTKDAITNRLGNGPFRILGQ